MLLAGVLGFVRVDEMRALNGKYCVSFSARFFIQRLVA